MNGSVLKGICELKIRTRFPNICIAVSEKMDFRLAVNLSFSAVMVSTLTGRETGTNHATGLVPVKPLLIRQPDFCLR